MLRGKGDGPHNTFSVTQTAKKSARSTWLAGGRVSSLIFVLKREITGYSFRNKEMQKAKNYAVERKKIMIITAFFAMLCLEGFI